MLLGEPAKVGPASAAGGSSVDDIITSAQNELDALEDFERELGLSASSSSFNAASASDSRTAAGGALAGTAASADDSFEENLDELEKYLQSLGNS
jgi:hypothetical protein